MLLWLLLLLLLLVCCAVVVRWLPDRTFDGSSPQPGWRKISCYFLLFLSIFCLKNNVKRALGGGGEGWDNAENFSQFWVIFQTLRNTNLCSHQAHLLEYSFLSVKVMWVKRNPLKAKSRKPQFNQSILMLF